MEIQINTNKIIQVLKKDYVLSVSLFLAVITSFISIPKIEYIDFKVLALLFNLMIIVAAFKELKVLDYAAVSILEKCRTYKGVMCALVFITFISSMLVTNDVSLITFVPITLIIGKKLNIDMMKTVIFQTMAANLGSTLTPMGNPQNLFIYTFYNMNTVEFFKITMLITLLSALILAILILKQKNDTIKIKMEKIKIENKKVIGIYSILLIVILFSVFRVIDYKIAFLITGVSVLFINNKLFQKVDYSLLITFICFFIFIGNISNLNIIKNFMENMLNSKIYTYYISLIASQFISNVPATMLLSGFTNNYKELLLGVDIGGLGTLIASLASVISYKLYNNDNDENSGIYLKKFTIYNFIVLIILVFAARIILIK